jgi:lipid A 3-O-deacylase
MRQALVGLGIIVSIAITPVPPVRASSGGLDVGLEIAQAPPAAMPLPLPSSVPASTAARYAQGASPLRAPPPRIVDEPRMSVPTATLDAGPRGPLSRPPPSPPGAKILWPPIAGHAAPEVSRLDRFLDRPPLVSEMRVGLSFHDVALTGRTEEGGFDFNGELLFQPPSWLGPIGAPRPHLGANVNSAGDTSLFYAGLTWTAQFSGGMFFEASLGAALHDGVEADARAKQKELGCPVLARFAASAGYLFDGGPHSLSVTFEHASNLGACERNEGLENFGLRYGYRF